jgi:hypothetical protein
VRRSITLIVVALTFGGCGGCVGCSARTSDATAVTSHAATLHGNVACAAGQSCSWHWEYRPVGGDDWTRSPDSTELGPVKAGARKRRVDVAHVVSGLAAGTRYEFRICPTGDGESDCVDARGSPGGDATTRFSTASFFAGFETGKLLEWSKTLFRPSCQGTGDLPGGEVVPNPSGAGRVARFSVTREQNAACDTHAKLYEIWDANGTGREPYRQDDGHLSPKMPAGNDMSGTYRASFLVPTGARDSSGGHTVIWDWKEWFPDENGGQVVNWGITISSADEWRTVKDPDGSPAWRGPSDSRPLMHVGGCGEANWEFKLKEVPQGRWFTIKAILRQGRSIDWYVDGTFWRRVSNARCPVGAAPNPGLTHSRTLSPPQFIWSVGFYGGIGLDYVDNASFTPAH